MRGLTCGGRLGWDLKVGHQRAVVEDEQLQVGAFKDLGGQLRRLHIRVIVVFAHKAMKESWATAEGMVAKMVHQMSHDHPRRQRDELHVSTALL